MDLPILNRKLISAINTIVIITVNSNREINSSAVFTVVMILYIPTGTFSNNAVMEPGAYFLSSIVAIRCGKKALRTIIETKPGNIYFEIINDDENR